LKRCDNHGVQPLGAHFGGHEKVIKVHHAGMNRIVHRDEKDTGGRHGHVGMPAVEQDRNVMIPMQENEGLVVNDNKEGIKEFADIKEVVSLVFLSLVNGSNPHLHLWKLAENKQLHPKTGRSRPIHGSWIKT